MKESGFEMIVCIVNKGYSDVVMDAARKAGAGGGTVIHARGTANKQAEKLFNLVIEPEKDMVLLLVPTTIRDAVLHAVYQAAGSESAGQSIAFALPVDSAGGLRLPEAENTKEETN